MNTPRQVRGQVLASAAALLISLAVLTLAVLGFAKADDRLGLFASEARQGTITLDVLAD